MATLSVKTAKDYALRHLVDLGYEDVTLGATQAVKTAGMPPMVVVGFTMRCDESPSGVYRGSMDVWVEDGELRGEW